MTQAADRLRLRAPLSTTQARDRGLLRAVVLLSGAVHPTHFQRSIARSLLDLPVDQGKSVLAIWLEQVRSLSAALGTSDIPVRLLLDRRAAAPISPAGVQARVEVERDSRELRGTGGILRDLAPAYDDAEFLLVGNGASLVLGDLAKCVLAMRELASDAVILSDHAARPTGLKLIRCGALRCLPEVGFSDLMEQGFPEIAKHHAVRVMPWELTTHSVRTAASYIGALQQYHRHKAGIAAQVPLAEDWQSSFSIREPGAAVESSAWLHDAVVLSGGRVGAASVAIRSVVCPGGILKPQAIAIDRVVSAEAKVAGEVD